MNKITFGVSCHCRNLDRARCPVPTAFYTNVGYVLAMGWQWRSASYFVNIEVLSKFFVCLFLWEAMYWIQPIWVFYVHQQSLVSLGTIF